MLTNGVMKLEAKDVFDSDGQPYYEFAEDYEREARFEKS
jgi:hypothetical protein